MGKKTPTNTDLKATCEIVLYSKATGHKTTTVNGVTFDDNIYDGDGGRCQENARKAYEATTGKPMPGKACCAGRTLANLKKSYALKRVDSGAGYRESEFRVGDYLFFSGGPACHTKLSATKRCGLPVAHVGIWLGHDKQGKARMFQHTSRDGLGITQQPPTASQKKRFAGAFRLLPLEGA